MFQPGAEPAWGAGAAVGQAEGDGGEVGGALPPAPAGRGGEVRARGGRERQQAQGSNVSSPYYCSN